MSPSLGQSRTIVCIVERRQLGNASENFRLAGGQRSITEVCGASSLP